MRVKVSVKVTRERLKITDKGRAAVAERLARANVANMQARLDRAGSPLPHTHDDNVDLYETGALQREVLPTEDGYEFLVPYAEYVDEKYGFAFDTDRGTVLPPDLERELGQLLETEGAELEEEEG